MRRICSVGGLSTRNMDTAGKPSQTPRRVHIACYLLLGAIFVYAGIDRVRRPLAVCERPVADPASAAQVETRLDPNTANWAELAGLPGIGESLARQIVAYREDGLARARVTATAPVVIFRCIQDLDAVPGLGEKKLQAIEPHLRFPVEKDAGE
jgi:DNA uptake protein ComE-like DNA-binding protein